MSCVQVPSENSLNDKGRILRNQTRLYTGLNVTSLELNRLDCDVIRFDEF